jgi:hypothetical protein
MKQLIGQPNPSSQLGSLFGKNGWASIFGQLESQRNGR